MTQNRIPFVARWAVNMRQPSSEVPLLCRPMPPLGSPQTLPKWRRKAVVISARDNFALALGVVTIRPSRSNGFKFSMAISLWKKSNSVLNAPVRVIPHLARLMKRGEALETTALGKVGSSVFLRG
jgi:hypothetical protein